MGALLIGILLVLVAVLAVARSLTFDGKIRWWTIPVFLIGTALIWLWFVYLRFPVVQPVG